MQSSTVKSYRKIDDLEREIIIGLTQKFGNSATAMTNYIRASGTTYGELSSYYQSLKFPSARKRIYDILTNAAKSVATQRVLDPLRLQPQETDKFDYVTTNDGIEETDVDRVTFIQQMLAGFTAQQQTQSSISVEPFNHSQQNSPMAQPTSSPIISTATVNTNDTLPQQSSPADSPLVSGSNLIDSSENSMIVFCDQDSSRAPTVGENKLTPPVLVDPLQSVASLPAVQSGPNSSSSAASSLPSRSTDLLHKLPPQLQNVNSLWTLFTSFVSNIADNPSSLQAVLPSDVIDSLVPSSSTVQPSKHLFCYPPKHHTLHSTFSLSNEELEPIYDVPASKRFCAHPHQTTTTPPSNQRKPPLQLASASKLSTKKKISVKGPVHFSTNNVLEDDDDERTSSQVSITTPNQHHSSNTMRTVRFLTALYYFKFF
ncbi:unnamed protein product [Didymodactylos carnosus]|uniref:Uncharacterized protein n=1 Tax=Didymodactylos carnosus TaxID=1234261 RepID=A0A8S2J035_9BILA|nr:unnamed protein product [Didymodactylos carnosus]CAF3788524.1 unnamed protein product [Didymodactylos carnosus]